MGSLRYLGDDDVRAALDLDELADALTTALVALSNGATSVPPRVGAFAVDGLLGAMPGFVPGLGLGAKLVTVFPGNSRRSLPTHQAVIASFDPDTGSPIALLDGTYITAVRTAVTSALAARALARHGSVVLAIVGSGVQAGAHVDAFTHLFTLGEVRIAAPIAPRPKTWRRRTSRRTLSTPSSKPCAGPTSCAAAPTLATPSSRTSGLPTERTSAR